MKIILWAPYGAGTHFWGPGTSAFRLYRKHLKECEVTLVHASDSQAVFPEVYVEQVKLPSLTGTGILGKIKYLNAARSWIKENGYKYDVFHGLSAFEYTFRPALYFSNLGKPAVIKITGHYGGFGKPSLLSKILGLARNRKKNANAIAGYISVSNDITENLKKIGVLESKIFQIPNGVDTDVFFPLDSGDKVGLRKQKGIQNIFTFVFVGGLTENKRIYECVQAVAILLKRGANIQLIIVGPDRSNGVILRKIERFIKDNNLSNRVFLIGQCNSPVEYLQISDVFLLPSKSEGMPNALLEAMACGLPSIVTPVSGSRDLISDKKNGLYTTGSPEDIATKAFLLFDKEVYISFSERSRKIISENFATSKILQEHLNVFRILTGTSK